MLENELRPFRAESMIFKTLCQKFITMLKWLPGKPKASVKKRMALNVTDFIETSLLHIFCNPKIFINVKLLQILYFSWHRLWLAPRERWTCLFWMLTENLGKRLTNYASLSKCPQILTWGRYTHQKLMQEMSFQCWCYRYWPPVVFLKKGTKRILETNLHHMNMR